MAVIKIACPKCGQKVSGDETFYGRSVNCPICTSKIIFPENPSVPNLDALASGGGVVPPANPSFETRPPSSRPEPAHPGQTPSFETVAPGSFPAGQPVFETIHPSNSSAHRSSGFDELPPQSTGQSLPPVPSAPSIPPVDQNAEVPSPLLGSVSLVVGILNTVTACVGGIFLAPIGIILGHAALAKAKNSPVKPAPGQSLATIGVILGYAGMVFTIIFLIVFLAFKEPIMELLKGASAA